MAKSKSSTRKATINSKIKDPVKPTWMRVLWFIMMSLLFVFLLLVLAGIMIRYYRFISKH